MYKDVLSKIVSCKSKIGIFGLGYVGLPLAMEFAKKGFNVTGLEVDDSRAKNINKGISYIDDVPSSDLSVLVKNGKLKASTDFSSIKSLDVIIVCVPTPLRKSKDPDVSYIVSATAQIKKYLKKNQLIVLESTTYPGTTKELLLPQLESTGLKCGHDFYLAFSPERVDPANKRFGIKNTPKVVGGTTGKCANLAYELYSQIVDHVHKVTSTESAEMVKLLENTFRAVNVALVNEVALMCDRLKLDVWEIIEAASTKPFGFMPFYPGPGIGGHCIPLDPHYLSWKLKTLNFYSRFIELAGEINSKMPEYLVGKVIDAVNSKGKAITKSKILVLGVSYKKDVADVRESPALDVIKLLIERKAKVSYFDPFVPEIKRGSLFLKSLKTLKNTGSYDAVVITTDHSDIDYKNLLKSSKLIIDSRNALKGIKSKKIVRL